MLQRYLRWKPIFAVYHALQYLNGDGDLSERPSEFDSVADGLGMEVDAVRRLRLLPLIRNHVQVITPKTDLEKMLGEPDFFMDLSFRKPMLNSDIVRKLLKKNSPANPRR